MRKSLLLYIYSTQNIVGSIFAIGGLALFFADIIFVYWLPIVMGLYLIGYRVTPDNKEAHLDEELAVKNPFQASENLVNEAIMLLPKSVSSVLERVWHLLNELLDRLDDFDSNDKVAYDIKQTAVRHLPELLEPYLSLPPAFAKFHPVKDSMTSKDILTEHLLELEDSLDNILKGVLTKDVNKLRVQGDFLRKTFLNESRGIQIT